MPFTHTCAKLVSSLCAVFGKRVCLVALAASHNREERGRREVEWAGNQNSLCSLCAKPGSVPAALGPIIMIIIMSSVWLAEHCNNKNVLRDASYWKASAKCRMSPEAAHSPLQTHRGVWKGQLNRESLYYSEGARGASTRNETAAVWTVAPFLAVLHTRDPQ